MPIEATGVQHDSVMHANAAPTFDDLTPTEQAAASLGVQPDSIKPIGWLNDAHYTNLKENNALDPTLARRIEAFRHVSAASEAVSS